MTTTLPTLPRAERANSPFERWMTCNGCGESIQVCGAVSDLIPGVYRGVWCGCRKPREPWVSAQGRRASAGEAAA